MLISRKHYDDLRSEWTKTHEEARVLAQQNAFLQTTLDWMRVRLTQIERERAQMLFTYTGVKIETPVFEAETPPGPSRQNVSDLLSAVQHFQDVGDTEAATLGVDWLPDGTLTYKS